MAFMGFWGTGVEPGTQYTEKVSCTVWKMMMKNNAERHIRWHGNINVATLGEYNCSRDSVFRVISNGNVTKAVRFLRSNSK